MIYGNEENFWVLGVSLTRSSIKRSIYYPKLEQVKPTFAIERKDWHILYIPENCQTALKRECLVEYKESCQTENMIRKECSESHKMICSYVDSNDCHTPNECSSGLKRECRTEFKKVCRSEPSLDSFSVLFNKVVRHCDLVPMKICRKKKCVNNIFRACANGKQKICQRKPFNICEDVPIQQKNCRKIPTKICRNLPKTICYKE